MNSSAPARRLPKLVELDSEGTIIFFKWSLEAGPSHAQNDLVGRNFFSEVAAFVNASELRERFKRFDGNRYSSFTFDFDCEYEDGLEHVRILLARLHEKEPARQPESFLMYIRKAA